MEAARTKVFQEVFERLLDAEKLKYCFESGVCTASCSIAELLDRDCNPIGLLEEISLDPENALTSDELRLCTWRYPCHRRCPQPLRLHEIFLIIRTIAAEHGYTQALGKAINRIVENITLPLVAASLSIKEEMEVSSCRSSF